jgi:hypothetical protein
MDAFGARGVHTVYKGCGGWDTQQEVEFMRFLGIILKVLRLEVSVYNVYITNQLQTSSKPLLLGGGE